MQYLRRYPPYALETARFFVVCTGTAAGRKAPTLSRWRKASGGAGVGAEPAAPRLDGWLWCPNVRPGGNGEQKPRGPDEAFNAIGRRAHRNLAVARAGPFRVRASFGP